MRNTHNVNIKMLLVAMLCLAAGCQSNYLSSQSTKTPSRAQVNKCQKMIEVARRFEEQGLHDQAKHVYSLIPRDSNCYPQAQRSLVNLGTKQQPAKINIASQNTIKRLPVADAPSPAIDSTTDSKAELLIKTVAVDQATLTPSSSSESVIPIEPEPIDLTMTEKTVTLKPIPLNMTEDSPESTCSTCNLTPGVVVAPIEPSQAVISELFTPPQPQADQVTNWEVYKTNPAEDAVTREQQAEDLFVEPQEAEVMNQELLRYKELITNGTITQREWKQIIELGAEANPLFNEIKLLMQHGNPEQRLHAAFALYKISGIVQPVMTEFQQALRSTVATEVGLAAYYLGEMGQSAGMFSKELRALVANGDTTVRVYAAEACIKILGPQTEFQLALCQIAEDEKSSVRVLATIVLSQVGMQLDPHVAESLFYLINDADHAVGAQAMMTLALLRPVEPRFKDLVWKIYCDESHPLHDSALVAWKCMHEQIVSQSDNKSSMLKVNIP